MDDIQNATCVTDLRGGMSSRAPWPIPARRRPERNAKVAPDLIPLLRGNDFAELDLERDDTGPIKGIAVSAAISLGLYGLLGLGVGLLIHAL